MREIQYAPLITFDNFQTFVTKSRRNDETDVADLRVTYAELIAKEGDELLHQHGNGTFLLFPGSFGLDTNTLEAKALKDKMADELGDNLWFGFSLAEYLGRNPELLIRDSLDYHSRYSHDKIIDFQDWQRQVVEAADDIKVLNKSGLYYPDKPDDMRYTTLKRNPDYVFKRVLRRLVRSLNNGSHDIPPFTATELEPIADLDLAVGDYLNSIVYVAHECLGWNIDDIARYNAHKLTHRAVYGKDALVP